MPNLDIFDSFENILPAKNIQFRVVKGLSYQFIVGRVLMKAVCPGDNGFMIWPDSFKILLNVNLKSLNLKASQENNIEKVKFCEISAEKDCVDEFDMDSDDLLVSSISPLTTKYSSIINLGTKEEPIYTSSERSTWFRDKLRSLLHRYSKVTSKKYKPFKIPPVKITTTGTIPAGGHRFIPLQPQRQKILKNKVEKMVSNGILSWTSDQANSCLMLTPKNNGIDRNLDAAWRVVNDLVRVNQYVKQEVYHLPPINHLLQQCQGFNLFCKVDIPDAYDCVTITSDQDFIAVVPGCNQNVKFNKLPQGLKPASGVFSIVLDRIFGSIEEILKYLDDLLIRATSEQELLLVLEKFLKTCDEFDVRISLEKSRFGVECLEFLSFKITNGRIGISESHRSAIEAIDGKDLAPDTLAGFLGYFSAYVDDKDLLHLLRQDTGWSEEKELALTKLKDPLVTKVLPLLSELLPPGGGGLGGG